MKIYYLAGGLLLQGGALLFAAKTAENAPASLLLITAMILTAGWICSAIYELRKTPPVPPSTFLRGGAANAVIEDNRSDADVFIDGDAPDSSIKRNTHAPR